MAHPAQLSDLPPELLSRVILRLRKPDRVNLRPVNRLFKQLVDESFVDATLTLPEVFRQAHAKTMVRALAALPNLQKLTVASIVEDVPLHSIPYHHTHNAAAYRTLLQGIRHHVLPRLSSIKVSNLVGLSDRTGVQDLLRLVGDPSMRAQRLSLENLMLGTGSMTIVSMIVRGSVARDLTHLRMKGNCLPLSQASSLLSAVLGVDSTVVHFSADFVYVPHADRYMHGDFLAAARVAAATAPLVTADVSLITGSGASERLPPERQVLTHAVRNMAKRYGYTADRSTEPAAFALFRTLCACPKLKNLRYLCDGRYGSTPEDDRLPETIEELSTNLKMSALYPRGLRAASLFGDVANTALSKFQRPARMSGLDTYDSESRLSSEALVALNQILGDSVDVMEHLGAWLPEVGAGPASAPVEHICEFFRKAAAMSRLSTLRIKGMDASFVAREGLLRLVIAASGRLTRFEYDGDARVAYSPIVHCPALITSRVSGGECPVALMGEGLLRHATLQPSIACAVITEVFAWPNQLHSMTVPECGFAAPPAYAAHALARCPNLKQITLHACLNEHNDDCLAFVETLAGAGNVSVQRLNLTVTTFSKDTRQLGAVLAAASRLAGIQCVSVKGEKLTYIKTVVASWAILGGRESPVLYMRGRNEVMIVGQTLQDVSMGMEAL